MSANRAAIQLMWLTYNMAVQQGSCLYARATAGWTQCANCILNGGSRRIAQDIRMLCSCLADTQQLKIQKTCTVDGADTETLEF